MHFCPDRNPALYSRQSHSFASVNADLRIRESNAITAVKPLIACARLPCSTVGSTVESCVVAEKIDYHVAFTHESIRSGGAGQDRTELTCERTVAFDKKQGN